MNITLNRAEIINKIHGCWLGKNIGGTLGGPFERQCEILHVDGFTTPKGEPLPNDDLDLQLVWLRALEVVGAKKLTANDLADYWLTYIAPYWNEYGVAKSNLQMGLLPPLSGEVENEKWKTSNGAWIRSEVWACLTPGLPNLAVKYAIMDATIDHGLSEGTYAEIFTVVLECMAFVERDIRTLIEKALTYIPENSSIAKTVRLVMECYDQKLPWQQTRERIVQLNAELGWFQAPGNIGFTVLGLLYGEGDVMQSMLYAVNCGDDTDCTAGTCGAILGIIYGADGIDQELKEYVGDRIVTMSINGSYLPRIPATCTELTERVVKLIPEMLWAHGIELQWSEKPTQIDAKEADMLLPGYAQEVFARGPYSFESIACDHTSAVVEYDRAPKVRPGEDIQVRVTLTSHRSDSFYYTADVYLPEGWSAEYSRTCHIVYKQRMEEGSGKAQWKMTIHVGDNVRDINRIPLMFHAGGHAVPVVIPMVLLG